MEQTIRRLMALVPALALVAGLAAAVRSTSDDHISEICVIGGDIVYCVPRNA